MMMREFKTSNGRTIKFEDKPLNQGGEGAIYKQYDELGHGDIGDLAKVFHEGKDKGKEEKIKAMLSIPAPKPSTNFAWPKEILYDVNTGVFRGYVMYLKYNKEELGRIAAPDCKYRKEKGWLFYLNIAKSLAQTVAGLHQINQVIGDLNDKNVLVDMETAQVTLIDNDSFHITSGSSTYRCCVGMGEYIAPEIQGVNFREAELPTFTSSTDNFSLAILIFKLLMNGLHPFTSTTFDEISIEENIRNGRSPFFLNENKGKSIEPPYAPPIDLIPSKLYRLFKLAFNDSLRSPHKRPTAQEFYDVLNVLLAESNTEKCRIANHVFPKGMPSCPWCYVEDKMYLLTSRGALQDDFTYSLYTKLYKESISNTQTNPTRKAEQDDHYMSTPNYGDVPSNPYNHQSMQQLSGTTVSPPTIASGRKTLSVVGCIGTTLITVIGCVVSYCISFPLIDILMAILFAILATANLPRLSSDNAYKSIVEFPDYITVKCKEKKTVWYAVVPKVKVYFISFLALSVIISLCVATVLWFNKMILWSWSAFSLLSIFNTYYITEKRTLWTKTALGIIIGVCCILTIILSVILFAQLLPKLFAF